MALKDKVLEILEDNRGRSVSGNKIAVSLGMTRSAVWKAVKQLREEGYTINAVTNRGYCLTSDNDILNEPSVISFLETKELGRKMDIFKSIDSTNNFAKSLAQLGAVNGHTIIAEQQTAGKGRMGKKFYAPNNQGIYLSVIVRPQLSVEYALMITSCAAVAVAEAIEKVSGLRCGIKWVNDLYYQGRKVCGILTEAGTDLESGQLEWLVVGIGLNLTATAEDFPPELAAKAGSLYPGGPAPVSRAALAGAIGRELLALCPGFACLDEYRARCFVPGHWVTVCTGTETYAAQALSIDDVGRLVVQREGGRTEALRCGEVTIRPTKTE